MDEVKRRDVMPLSEAARRLRLSWSQTFNAVLRGELDGTRAANGRWAVSAESVERFAACRGADVARPVQR
jgi:hypothetical protein